MPPVPLLKPREVVNIFEKLGWRLARQKGSHLILIKVGHPARAGLTVDQFLDAMEG